MVEKVVSRKNMPNELKDYAYGPICAQGLKHSTRMKSIGLLNRRELGGRSIRFARIV